MKVMMVDFPVVMLEELIVSIDEEEYALLIDNDSTTNWILGVSKPNEMIIHNRMSPDNYVVFHGYKTNDGKWFFGVKQVNAHSQKTDVWIYSKMRWRLYPMPEWVIKDFVSEQVVLPAELNVSVRPYLTVEMEDVIRFRINTYTFLKEASNHFQINDANLEHNYIKYTYELGSSLAMQRKQDKDFAPLLNVLANVEPEEIDGPGQDSFNCPQGVSVISSSVLAPQSTFSYKASNLLDESSATAWCEGVKGSGIGEWIEFAIVDQFLIGESYQITNGYGKDKNSWRNNGRVKRMKCFINGQAVASITLQDEMVTQSFTISPTWFNRSLQIQKGDKIRFVIEEVYKGLKYEDTLITQFVPTGNCG